MKPLSLEWTNHIREEDERTRFEQSVRSSSLVLSRLLQIIEQRENELDRQEAKLSDYDTPAWSHKQAHRNGERSSLKKLSGLLNFIRN